MEQLDPIKAANFISSWLRHNNVRRAMREAGIGSPATAYRLIRQYRQHPTEGWAPAPPRKTRQVDSAIAGQIIQMREEHPTWGKLQIARRLEAVHRRQVVSPSGVQAVLQHARLWVPLPGYPPMVPIGARNPLVVHSDALLAATQRGVQLDLHGESQTAIPFLEGCVWAPLLGQPDHLPTLLTDPELGSWLMCGLIQLGHALIDTGRWGLARYYLAAAVSLMDGDAGRLSPAQVAYQEDGLRMSVDVVGPWTMIPLEHAQPLPAGTEHVSLRQDALWLEAKQYLSLVTRDAPNDEPLDALSDVRKTLLHHTRRRIVPTRAPNYRGVIEHDLAALKLRRRFSLGQIERHLEAAEPLLIDQHNAGMLAAIYLTRARAQRRNAAFLRDSGSLAWVRQLDEAEASVHRALAVVQNEDSPMLRANVAISATLFLLEHRAADEGDRRRLQGAASLCVEHGFAHQARQVLDSPLACGLLGDVSALQRLVQH
ncbi:MAG: helix-turn-helix domain-containing protein [Thermomicrobiales bacterium]